MSSRDTDRSDRPPEGQRADDGREAGRTVPTDPYLLVGRAVTRLLATLNRAYDSFEDLPGWARIWFGVSTFLVSAYYGQAIKGTIDAVVAVFLTDFVGNVGRISFGVLAVLGLVTLVSVQALFIELHLDALRERVEERFNRVEGKVERSMGPADHLVPDGGQFRGGESTLESVDSTGAGALSGATAGAALGAVLGPGPVLGGLVMGAIVGDEYEKWSIRNRRRRSLEARIVRTLLTKRAGRTNPVRRDVLSNSLPTDPREDVRRVLEDLVDDAAVPVASTDAGEIYLDDLDSARVYLASRR